MNKKNQNLAGRTEKILMAAIKEYISTAAPVSSGTIAQRHPMDLCPATIRNVMASLDREGYLYRPHPSAGRIPTDKGFRFYVDTLLEFDEPKEGDKTLIRAACEGYLNQGAMMRHATKALSSVTICAGFVLFPGQKEFLMKEIKILHVGDSSRMLVVVVSTTGTVHTKLVWVEGGTKDLDPEKASNYLNSIAKGLTLAGLRDRVREELRKGKNLYDRLVHRALMLGEMYSAAGEVPSEEGIYLEGKTNIFAHPEFTDDIGRIKRVLSALEEKSLLVKILDESMKKDGRVSIRIGSECNLREFEGLSFIAASYGKRDSTAGSIGIIGPVRMNYPRIIPLVDYAASSLSNVL
ncbi:MAG: heat-inducible transcription repressor HrcA [Deltaproteobacteria bacterium]|nr:heat-inducible transcription repressor HrcA [Deltaproteobacteria bacterium]